MDVGEITKGISRWRKEVQCLNTDTCEHLGCRQKMKNTQWKPINENLKVGRKQDKCIVSENCKGKEGQLLKTLLRT